MLREQSLARAFVELADTLVADFDVVDLLHVLANRCVELLGVQAAGLMLADQRGQLRLMASSSEQSRLLELFELETDEGPCVVCYQTGAPTSDGDLDRPDPRWPRFGRQATAAGFHSIHALPMRLRTEVIGVLNLFSATPLRDEDIRVGQALADVATIGLLQHRAIEHRQMLAERLGLDMGQAFNLLRAQARTQNRRLADLASVVADGSEDMTAWVPARPSR